jgi:hypothetical protein
LNFDLQNHLPPVSLPSKIEIVATPSGRPLPTAPSYFTQSLFRIFTKEKKGSKIREKEKR